MNSKFFDLKKEKQDRIINAALKGFALQGYRHAGTDEMVKEAAISKGLLFHYFESKIGLYRFVYNYSVRYMSLELKSTVNAKEKDLFEVIRQKELARMQVMKGYPYMQQFLNRSMLEDSPEALDAVEDRRLGFQKTLEEIDGQIDLGLLPEGVDGEKLRKMLDFTIRGLMTEKLLEATFRPEALYEEICGYLDMTRQLVYKTR